MKTGACIVYFLVYGVIWPYFSGGLCKRFWHIGVVALCPLGAFILGMLAK